MVRTGTVLNLCEEVEDGQKNQKKIPFFYRVKLVCHFYIIGFCLFGIGSEFSLPMTEFSVPLNKEPKYNFCIFGNYFGPNILLRFHCKIFAITRNPVITGSKPESIILATLVVSNIIMFHRLL